MDDQDEADIINEANLGALERATLEDTRLLTAAIADMEAEGMSGQFLTDLALIAQGRGDFIEYKDSAIERITAAIKAHVVKYVKYDYSEVTEEDIANERALRIAEHRRAA